MNLKVINARRAIALEQAKVSQAKAIAFAAEAKAYNSKSLLNKSHMYNVRYEALLMYATHLNKQMNDHKKKQFKKEQQ